MQATREHDAIETDLSSQAQKGKRKQQRKSKKDAYAKEQARLRRESDQSSLENVASGGNISLIPQCGPASLVL